MVHKMNVADTYCGAKSSVRGRPCGGVLVQTEDGEGRLSNRTGRVVLKCTRCKLRWSFPVSARMKLWRR